MYLSLDELGLSPKTTQTTASYIAIEGPIGVGKTTLARSLAHSLECDALYEAAEDNPFLNRFYRDPKAYALPTQLHFLFQRISQIEDIKQNDIFNVRRVADFLIDKDPLFAEVNLDSDQFAIYQKVFDTIILDAPKPDLVVYLQAPTDVLIERIRKRGIESEQKISNSYLAQLNDAYMRYFHNYAKSPLLIVNAAEIDFVQDKNQYRNLVETIVNTRSGRHYYNPLTRDI